jgi:hypothetical protein
MNNDFLEIWNSSSSVDENWMSRLVAFSPVYNFLKEMFHDDQRKDSK